MYICRNMDHYTCFPTYYTRACVSIRPSAALPSGSPSCVGCSERSSAKVHISGPNSRSTLSPAVNRPPCFPSPILRGESRAAACLRQKRGIDPQTTRASVPQRGPRRPVGTSSFPECSLRRGPAQKGCHGLADAIARESELSHAYFPCPCQWMHVSASPSSARLDPTTRFRVLASCGYKQPSSRITYTLCTEVPLLQCQVGGWRL